MKQQMTVALAVVLMTSSVFATPRGTPTEGTGPIKSERQKQREREALGRGERPQTSAAGTTQKQTTQVKRTSILSQFAGLGPHSAALEVFETRSFKVEANIPGAEGQKPEVKTIEVKGEEVLKDLDAARSKVSENVEVNQLREAGVKQALQLSELVQQRMFEIPDAGVNKMNAQAVKFVRDYAKALNDPRSTAADLQGYILMGKSMLEYSAANPKAFLHEIYEKGTDPEGQKRQAGCLEG